MPPRRFLDKLATQHSSPTGQTPSTTPPKTTTTPPSNGSKRTAYDSQAKPQWTGVAFGQLVVADTNLSEIMTSQQAATINVGLRPQVVVTAMDSHLTELDWREMLRHSAIYYLPSAAFRPQRSGTTKYSFDDDEGHYRCFLSDHLAFRYQILEILGQGTFCRVLLALDHATGQRVAIKVARNNPSIARQAYREIDTLRHLGVVDPDDSHNIVHMIDQFIFRSHVCIVLDLCHVNVFSVLSQRGFKGFAVRDVQRMTRCVLKCLSVLQVHHIVHCDLKPENLVFRDDDGVNIKVIDFGASCQGTRPHHGVAQSLFYRAPEVILDCGFGPAADMWSLGCIVAELYTGYPLFAARNEVSLLQLMITVLGPPSKEVLASGHNTAAFFDDDGTLLPQQQQQAETQHDDELDQMQDCRRRSSHSCGHDNDDNNRLIETSQTVAAQSQHASNNNISLDHILQGAGPDLVDFVRRCLTWDPNERIRALTASTHPFIQRRNSTNSIFHKQPSSDQVVPKTATANHKPVVSPTDKKETSTTFAKAVVTSDADLVSFTPGSTATATTAAISTHLTAVTSPGMEWAEAETEAEAEALHVVQRQNRKHSACACTLYRSSSDPILPNRDSSFGMVPRRSKIVLNEISSWI